MTGSVPVVLVAGLNCTARLYSEQIPLLWQFGPVTVADHRQDETVAAIAHRVLAAAPPLFALVGLSLGGYIAFAMLRQAPERIVRLALLDTTVRPDTPEASELRRRQIALAQAGRFAEVVDLQIPRMFHVNRHQDPELRRILRTMAEETGPEVFVRQQQACMTRPDSTPDLAAISCPTLVVVGDGDTVTPPALAKEMAAGIHGSHLVTIPDSGHLTTLERPQAVNAALAEWMQR